MTTAHVPIPEFGGRIGRTRAESEPSFGERPHPGEDSPNVVIVLLDDTGFAQFGCYGSDIDTANVDRLAADGLQFTNFHVTPLCSPTRAALMTGRSQHAVGMRTLANFSTGFPNQLGHISNHAATVAEVLGAEGYATLCAGKWHLARTQDGSAAGPFDQWPLGRGFNRFYGFLEGETDQFHPELVIDNHRADPPCGPEEGYHLSEDLVDQLLLMISDSKGVRPDRPFFAYLPFGATHAPHQSPAGYLAKYRGCYDEGWDVVRERWYRRQFELGVIPEGTRLAPRNPGVEPWDSLPDSHRRFAARLQEAFAAFLDHTDDQIGRLVDGLDRMGQLDNTILMVLSDNGASQEGGPFGVMHEMKWFNGVPEVPEEAIARIDEIGGPRSYVNYPWGWAQCGNTPFKWYKQNTHEGGVHVPLVVHWPDGIAAAERGTLRRQFINVSDIVPTMYELLGVNPPEVFKGLEQMPVTGHSFAGVLHDAAHPPTNTLQYFEMHGSRALVAGPWKAVCRHVPGDDFETEQWELYDLSADWSECEDLASQRPEKLAELIDLWWSEAERNGALPLDDQWVGMFSPRLDDRSPHPVSRRYRYRLPMSPIAVAAAANPGGRKFDLDARVTRTPGDDGVIWATGSASAGVTMFVQNDRLVVDYNAYGDHTVLESSTEIPAGDSVLSMGLRRLSRTSGTLEIAVDGSECGRCDLPVFMGIVSANGASIGRDHGSAVSDRYSGPFPFTGTLHEVEIRLAPRTRVDNANTARAEMARQ